MSSRSADRYDAAHRRLRARIKPSVEAGKVTCWRCAEPIGSAEAWDLGHDDDDPTKYRGPEHANRCNRRAAGLRWANRGKRTQSQHPALST